MLRRENGAPQESQARTSTNPHPHLKGVPVAAAAAAAAGAPAFVGLSCESGNAEAEDSHVCHRCFIVMILSKLYSVAGR